MILLKLRSFKSKSPGWTSHIEKSPLIGGQNMWVLDHHDHESLLGIGVQEIITILMWMEGAKIHNEMSTKGIRYKYLAICPVNVLKPVVNRKQ